MKPPSLLLWVLLSLTFTLSSIDFVTSLFRSAKPTSPYTTKPTPNLTAGGHEKYVDQVVLILIDALRPDFALRSLGVYSKCGGDCNCDTFGDNDLRFSGPTLTYIEEQLRHPTRPSIGAYFVADSPTTTSQRLKALTTGTIPAFLDAGKNFNSDEVLEDSIVQQLAKQIIVLGDDTWLHLYPEANGNWLEYVVFPSFHVSDLHSNDDGVLDNLYRVLNRDTTFEAKMVIAHFLGVDHAGHTFNAHNRHMDSKLSQLNVVLRNVSQSLEKRSSGRTLMVVLGDHGMTDSGDHGGATPQETDSFLFAEMFDTQHKPFSSEPLAAAIETRWANCDDDHLCRLRQCAMEGGVGMEQGISALWQIDFVPTISALLGASIPRDSLGHIFQELLIVSNMTLPERAGSARENLKQLFNATGAFGDEERSQRCPLLWETIRSTSGDSSAGSTTDWFSDVAPLNVVDACLKNVSWGARRQRVGANLHRASCGLALTFGAVLVLTVLGFLQSCNGRRQSARAILVSICTTVSGGVLAVCVVFRFAVLFSNSYVVKESVCVTAIAVIIGLLIASRSTAPRILFIIAVLRFAFPLGWRERTHGTHLLTETTYDRGQLNETGDSVIVDLCRQISVMCVGMLLAGRSTFRSTVSIVSGATVLAWHLLSRFYSFHAVSFVGAVTIIVVRCCSNPKMSNSTSMTKWSPTLLLVLWSSGLCRGGAPSATVELHALSVVLLSNIFSERRSTLNGLHAPLHFLQFGFVLHLLSSLAFFGEGTQSTFTAIDWVASTVGIESWLDAPLPVKGFLVAWRTLSPMLMTVALLPQRDVNDVAPWFAIFSCVQSLCSMIAAFVLNEHLMLFEIFGPKLLFDAAGSIILLGAVLVRMTMSRYR